MSYIDNRNKRINEIPFIFIIKAMKKLNKYGIKGPYIVYTHYGKFEIREIK